MLEEEIIRHNDFSDLYIIPTHNRIDSRRTVDVSTSVQTRRGSTLKLNLPLFLSNMSHVSDMMAAIVAKMGGVVVLQHDRPGDEMIERIKRIRSIMDSDHWIDEFAKSYPSINRNVLIEEFSKIYQQNDETCDIIVALGPNNHHDNLKLRDLAWMIKDETGTKMICLDTANGYMDRFLHLIEEFATISDDLFLITGNVCTSFGASLHLKAGSDMVKLGIGSSITCATRNQTAVGVPQARAISETKMGESRIKILSDGGTRQPRDLCLALALGSHSVMVGSLYATCVENEHRGLVCGSAERSNTFNRNHQIDPFGFSEGFRQEVPVTTNTLQLTHDLISGLRSSMSYVNASSIYNYYYLATTRSR